MCPVKKGFYTEVTMGNSELKKVEESLYWESLCFHGDPPRRV